ncbi:hypothetical protein Hanom_Chr02g00103361 [Helianthus anomalus]
MMPCYLDMLYYSVYKMFLFRFVMCMILCFLPSMFRNDFIIFVQ